VDPFIDENKVKAYSNQGLHDISDVLYSLYEVRKHYSTLYLKEEDKHKKFNLYKDIEKLNKRIKEVLLIDE
jgi:hypothetical protein